MIEVLIILKSFYCSVQLELDKTAEDFRQAHKERQELLSQWENTIQQMHQRDTEMDSAALQLMELKVDVKKRQDDIKDRQVRATNFCT